MCSRTSRAMNVMKLTTCSGSPANRLRSSGSCVATPTGQVLRWQARIITQPIATSGAVANPNSSAPSRAPTTTSRPGLELPVHLDHDPAAQVVHEQDLVRLGEAQLPRDAGVLDGRERRGARPAVVARDQDHVRVRLGHARRHGPHAHLGHELHADPGLVVRVLEVVDELLEVLDGVDVVVRGRADEPDAGRGVAGLRDPRVDLGAGELAALAGLGALGHLDLDLAGVDQVLAGDAEAARRHLLDGAAPRVAVGQRLVARRVLAALAGVGLAADPVHRDRQRLVGLAGDRAVATSPRS